jgi:division protein CdvB (Snf7/Vps24/ESCRT-III family)
MTELETAKNRLEKSIARLEAAVKSQAELAAAGDDDGAAEALAESQRLCAELKDANQAVTNRLDVAIGRLKTVLEG